MREIIGPPGCDCGYKVRRVGGIPILLPPGEAAVWHDSDGLVARMGRSWRSRLDALGERTFAAKAAGTPRRKRQDVLVTAAQIRLANRLSSPSRIRRDSAPTHEPDTPIRWIVDAAARLKPRRVLDIGIGGGFLLTELSLRLPRAALTGIDLDYVCLRVSSARVKLLGGDASVYGADARRLPFADSRFDCVTSNFALWHMEDYRTVLSEVARVLRPGGALIACEMGHGSLVPGASRRTSLGLAKAFGLHGSLPALTTGLREHGFRLRHIRRRRSAGMAWQEIHAELGRRCL